MITDNIIVAFELIYSMKRKRRGKYGEVALKLDISKAYDLILMSVKNILNDYERALGQAANYRKSGIVFSSNVEAESAATIKDILGVNIPQDHGRYLGLPSLIGKNKMQNFSILKERLQACLGNWKSRILSRSGKEILLKTVAQALPNYCMNVFLIPLGTCDALQKMMNSFWLGWNLIDNSSSFPTQILKAKYYPRNGFLDACEGYNPSFIWKSILRSRDVLKRGTRWRIGNNASVSVWNDPWIPKDGDYYVHTPMMERMEDLQVKDLINEDATTWDATMIRGIFSDIDVHIILRIPLPRINCHDRLVWTETMNGYY
ncbi:uncharacterized protein [Rutidosis leptorrhynchoides]|uniref:uncharacterized protein n=1 Tax=Rutidosis leptorrhynchoides TaxID=125765 RepID=UPI003A98D75F